MLFYRNADRLRVKSRYVFGCKKFETHRGILSIWWKFSDDFLLRCRFSGNRKWKKQTANGIRKSSPINIETYARFADNLFAFLLHPLVSSDRKNCQPRIRPAIVRYRYFLNYTNHSFDRLLNHVSRCVYAVYIRYSTTIVSCTLVSFSHLTLHTYVSVRTFLHFTTNGDKHGHCDRRIVALSVPTSYGGARCRVPLAHTFEF